MLLQLTMKSMTSLYLATVHPFVLNEVDYRRCLDFVRILSTKPLSDVDVVCLPKFVPCDLQPE